MSHVIWSNEPAGRDCWYVLSPPSEMPADSHALAQLHLLYVFQRWTLAPP